MTRQAISKHLRVLATAGIVTDARRGRESLWTLDPRSLDEARRSLDRISRHWDDALARLKVFVEGSTLSASARNRSPRSAESDSGGG